jgi:hypothetical protein
MHYVLWCFSIPAVFVACLLVSGIKADLCCYSLGVAGLTLIAALGHRLQFRAAHVTAANRIADTCLLPCPALSCSVLRAVLPDKNYTAHVLGFTAAALLH